ncbi:MAG TPA: gluconate 2-dehydrogenase subunit 3 family protein [Puia sp.]|nr:gluconate 2-dehydrogenase subunit 3 family protein [Puia sp.]
MKRRKAIVRMAWLGGGAVAAYSGYKWYSITKSPDIDFLKNHRNLIAELADTIIPPTDSPGAKEAGVHDYIILMVQECTEKKTQNKFISGLKELIDYTQSQYGKSFEQCNHDQRMAVLKYFEETGKNYKGIAGKIVNRYFGKSFFTTLRDYTAEGYCTSEIGATKGLAYLYIPGKYIGCEPLQQGQKSWATK